MKSARSKALRFRRIRLENWRNFAHVDVPLKSRAFLVGPNASGKSNFLDACRFLQDIVRVGGGFAEAVGPRRGGVTKLRSLMARRYPDVAVAVEIGTDQTAVWEYELHFSQNKQRPPTITYERVAHHGRTLWERPNSEDRRDPERLTQTYLEQINVNKDFREVAGFFRSIRYLHIVPQLVREPDRSIGKANDPYGGDFLEQIARTSGKTRDAWLRRIQKALKIAIPQLSDLHFYRDKVRGTPHLRGNYEHWRAHGAWQNEDQFSDGTLRLVGVLWAILEGSGPLLLEEPELSLHPDVVSQLARMFAAMQMRTGCQVLVSTHSPSLLVDEGIGLDEVLLLTPGPEGTSVRPANSFEQVVKLLEGGASLADAILPYTRPANLEQLSLFP